MKSVEFLVAVFLLLWLFSFLYQDAKGYLVSTQRALDEFNESLTFFEANSIVNSLISYGEPFEYLDFSKIDPSRLNVKYDSATGQYYYSTYSRW